MEEDVDDTTLVLVREQECGSAAVVMPWLCVEVVGARNLESTQAVDAYCVVRVGATTRDRHTPDDAVSWSHGEEAALQDDDVGSSVQRPGGSWRSRSSSATVDPVWSFRVETRLCGEEDEDHCGGDQDELLAVEIFSEKSFFFDMFPSSHTGSAHGNRMMAETESEAAYTRSSDGSTSDGSDHDDNDDADGAIPPAVPSTRVVTASALAVASNTSTMRRRRRRRGSSTSGTNEDLSRLQPAAHVVAINASDEALGVAEISLALLRRRAARGVVATDEWYILRGARSGEVRIRTLLQPTRPRDVNEMQARWDDALLMADPSGSSVAVDDHYGFRIPPSSVREWMHLRSYHVCRERRRVAEWEATFGSHFFSLPSAQSSAVVKRLAREGIPRHWRQRVYMAMSGALAKQQSASSPEYYASLVDQIDTHDSSSFRQIELDIDRTFGHSGTKISTHDGRATLRRVLRAYSLHNPSVGYCQGLNFIVGFLTLLLDEESTFWLLAVICEDFFPGYYIPTMTDTQTDMLVLKQLIADELPELEQFTADVGLPLELLGSQWLLCLFTTTFPAETVFRIFDCIMTEGPHFVFAVIMAHLRRLESQLLVLDEFQAVLSTMKDAENALFDADAFLRLALQETQHITADRIARLRDEHSVSVLNEMQRADRARALNRQLAVVYQIPAFSSTAANLLRFFHEEAEMSSRSDVAFVLTLLCHGLVWLAEHSKHLRR